MAITTVDSLTAAIIGSPAVLGKDATTAEAAGIPHTPWYTTGLVPAGAAPSGGLNGATFSSTATGQFAGAPGVPAPVTGERSRLLAWNLMHAGGIGAVWLIDRIWGNVPVVTTTTSQAITSPTWPARDSSGSTGGAGVFLALECSSATGNAGAITNTTVSYTSSDGIAGRTGTLSSYPATAVAGTFVPISIATGTGDIGVRSVQSITLGTSYVSGQVHLVAYRLLAQISVPTANVGTSANWTALGLPNLWDGTVLQLVYWPTGTSVGAVAGSLSYAQG